MLTREKTLAVALALSVLVACAGDPQQRRVAASLSDPSRSVVMEAEDLMNDETGTLSFSPVRPGRLAEPPRIGFTGAGELKAERGVVVESWEAFGAQITGGEIPIRVSRSRGGTTFVIQQQPRPVVRHLGGATTYVLIESHQRIEFCLANPGVRYQLRNGSVGVCRW